MNIERKTLGILALAAAAVLMAGCDKKDDKAATPAAPSTSAPASSSSTPPAATTPAPSSSAATPAECEAYVAKVNACMDKLGNGNPAVASFKQQMEAAKAQWAAVTDKTQLASQCKQASDLFAIGHPDGLPVTMLVGAAARRPGFLLLCGRSPHAVRPFCAASAPGRRNPSRPAPSRRAQSVRRTTLEPARQQQGVLP